MNKEQAVEAVIETVERKGYTEDPEIVAIEWRSRSKETKAIHKTYSGIVPSPKNVEMLINAALEEYDALPDEKPVKEDGTVDETVLIKQEAFERALAFRYLNQNVGHADAKFYKTVTEKGDNLYKINKPSERVESFAAMKF